MFDSKKLTAKGTEAVFTTKTAFHNLMTTVEKTGVVQGREYAIFKTKLEEACFWGVRAQSVDPTHHYTDSGEETGKVN